MSYIIALAGKGGTGKTTTSALIVRILAENKRGSILAVDADPNSNLAELLGVKAQHSVGQILDDIASHLDRVPAGMSKDTFIEYQVQTAIVESNGFDLLTMGRPEGPGCYCYVNNVLRNVLARLTKDYDYIVVDNEAGLEHFSRRTTRACDTLVVISDPTAQGLRAAKRISELVRELGIKTKKNILIINSSDQDIDQEKIKNINLDYIGHIPHDKNIEKISLEGGSMFNLADNADSISALRKMREKIWR